MHRKTDYNKLSGLHEEEEIPEAWVPGHSSGPPKKYHNRKKTLPTPAEIENLVLKAEKEALVRPSEILPR